MVTVGEIRTAVREAWGPDTCDPKGFAEWRADNPGRGQCGMTAMVVQDLLGGELVLGEVQVVGSKVGHHYWNQLPDGTLVDLTADQFHQDETVVGGEVRHRPPDAPRRCRGQYQLLRHRVFSSLAAAHPDLAAGPPVGPPVRIAVVVVTDPAGAVLLQLRSEDAAAEPGQWALPGGHIELGESPSDAAVREIAEETGLVVAVRPVCQTNRPDLTRSGSAVELHVFAADTDDMTIRLGEGQHARFVKVPEAADLDLSPTAAAVLHGLFAQA
jgi:8-oxo-dGTP pyrophosphatase MutT (NUDIX family)